MSGFTFSEFYDTGCVWYVPYIPLMVTSPIEIEEMRKNNIHSERLHSHEGKMTCQRGGRGNTRQV